MKNVLADLQRVLKNAGLYLSEIDDEWGPLSQAALDKAIRLSKEVPSPPVAAPSGKLHPFILVAREWMGKTETSRNRFEGDRKLWADTSYGSGWNNREPYCAAFVCHVVAESQRRGAKPKNLPKSASVRELRNWARERGLIVPKPKPGDLFTLLPSGASHIGIVESVSGSTINTLEGNTDGAGSREGDGFWKKSRKIASCDFIRIPLA